jgi:hypothetical protein
MPARPAGRVIAMARSSARSRKDTPYLLDRAFVQVHRSAAGVLWRFRTEMAACLAAAAGIWQLDRAIAATWTVVILTASAALVTVLPPVRRQVTRRVCCVLSRHRIHRVCFETRMHTRSGRLPLVLRIYPTEVGERAIIWCRAGICAEDFELNAAEIAAACYARQARIEGHRRWAQIVILDIVRRDTLAPHYVISSGLVAGRSDGRQSPAA